MSHLSVTYELKEESLQHWSLINEALSRLAASKRVWLIESENPTYDWKRNAGSLNLVDRKQARVAPCQPDFIQCNLNAFCIQAGRRRVFFLPNRVYFCQFDKYTAVSMSEIEVRLDTISFIEEEHLPADADVVGSTWKYVNKDGSPDLRFMDNCPLPIVEYAVLTLLSDSGHCACLYVSSAAAAQAFVDIMRRAKQSSSSVLYREQSSQKEASQDKAPVSEQFTDCFVVLGVAPQCTSEEVSVAYRRMAKQYHPDTVCRLAPEFRQLAEERMKQINQAYAEIKKIKNVSCEMLTHHAPPTQEALAHSFAAAGSKIRLVRMDGLLAGKVFEISRTHCVVGRDDGCDIRLTDDLMASRRHAYIIKRDDTYTVRDNNSTNGTFVNGRRLAEQVLRTGDVVQFGNSKFRFE